MNADERAWTLPGADGQVIHGSTHVPAGAARGVLLIAHGFKGYKDYGFFPSLAAQAARRGLVAHRFNFSHSGMTLRIETFERPDLFERDTIGKQVHDLKTVAATVREGTLPGADLPLIVFGHSRGGITAALAADQGLEACGLALAAAPHTAHSLSQAQQRTLLEEGSLESPSSRTGQRLRVGRTWLEEIVKAPARFDPLAAAARLTCPLLILHGQDDRTVPVAAAHAYARVAGDRARLEIIPRAGHTFECPNPPPPDSSMPAATRRMVELTCDFALSVAAHSNG